MSPVHLDISPGQLFSVWWLRDPVCFNHTAVLSQLEVFTLTMQRGAWGIESRMDFSLSLPGSAQHYSSHMSVARLIIMTPHNAKGQRSVVFQEQEIRYGIWWILLSLCHTSPLFVSCMPERREWPSSPVDGSTTTQETGSLNFHIFEGTWPNTHIELNKK